MVFQDSPDDRRVQPFNDLCDLILSIFLKSRYIVVRQNKGKRSIAENLRVVAPTQSVG